MHSSKTGDKKLIGEPATHGRNVHKPEDRRLFTTFDRSLSHTPDDRHLLVRNSGDSLFIRNFRDASQDRRLFTTFDSRNFREERPEDRRLFTTFDSRNFREERPEDRRLFTTLCCETWRGTLRPGDRRLF